MTTKWPNSIVWNGLTYYKAKEVKNQKCLYRTSDEKLEKTVGLAEAKKLAAE